MTGKTRYVLLMAAFWGITTAIATNLWSVWIDHRPFSWPDTVLRLFVFCLAGLGFGASMWSVKARRSGGR